MGFAIDWKIDPINFSEEPATIEDITGSIMLTGDNDLASIRDEYTYIYFWLEALSKGFQALMKGEDVVIDITIEPSPIVFLCYPESSVIKYNDKEIHVYSIALAIEKLVESMKRYKDEIVNFAGHDSIMLIDKAIGDITGNPDEG